MTPPRDPADLRAERLTLAYQDVPVVSDLDVQVPPRSITALVGANGSGKSTLLKALARILVPRGGAALLDGKAIHRLSTREVARRLAILPQNPDAPEGLTVRELVSYGRYPHQSGFGALGEGDRDAIARAMDTTGVTVFADRPVGSLSGGQRQRAWIAMALAQETEVLLLDEPTTFLDMAHQIEVLELLRRLNGEQGRTIVMVVHDLNHASRYAHHVVGIAGGRVAVEGPPAAVVTRENLRRLFAVDAHIVPDPDSGAPLCIPFGLRPHDNREVGL